MEKARAFPPKKSRVFLSSAGNASFSGIGKGEEKRKKKSRKIGKQKKQGKSDFGGKARIERVRAGGLLGGGRVSAGFNAGLCGVSAAFSEVGFGGNDCTLVACDPRVTV